MHPLNSLGMGLTTTALTACIVAAAAMSVAAQSAAPPAPPNGLADNGLIAFDSAGDIWVAEPDGSEPRRFTNGTDHDSSPVWSPDGSRLAFWSQADRSAPSRLVVVNADGSQPTTIATHEGGQVPWRMDWSPDGTRVAYSACEDGTLGDCWYERIFVAAADGPGVEMVGDPELGAARPDWSPDGRWIAFQGSPQDGSPGAYVMAADGSDVRRLEQVPHGDAYNAFVVQWSPDGGSVATAGGDPLVVVIVEVDDGSATTLTDGFIPWWSPDGEWIAFEKTFSDLWLISADGSREVDVPIAALGSVVWSPDASRLLVGTEFGGDTGLAIVDATTGDVIAEIPTPDQSYPDNGHWPSWQRVAP